MFKHLIERDVVEALELVVGRIEQAGPRIQSVTLGNAKDILVGFDSVRIAAPRPVVGEGLAEAAPDIEDPDVSWNPTERGRPLSLKPGTESPDFDVRLEFVQAQQASRVDLAVQRGQLRLGEDGRNEPMPTRRTSANRECPGETVAIVVEVVPDDPGRPVANRTTAARD
jgi:hypothetical protein